MKRVSLALILIGLLCAGSAAWAQVELLTNPGFEDNTGTPAGWTITSTHNATTTSVVIGRTSEVNPPPSPQAASSCSPGTANEGSNFITFSTNNGASPQPAGSGAQVAAEQTHNVDSYIASIDGGTATLSVIGQSTSMECLESPDRAHVEVLFCDALDGGGTCTTMSTMASCTADPTTDPCRPPDGSGSTDSGGTVWDPIVPRQSNWRAESLAGMTVPVGTRSVTIRLVGTLGPAGGSIGIGGDAFSAQWVPVELQSFSID